MQDSSTILVFTSTGAEPEARRSRAGVDDFARRTADRVVEVSTDSLKRSVVQAYRSCMEMIQSLPASSGSGLLETVTFSLAVSAEGQVGLLSTTAKAGTQVGLTFQVRIAPPANRDPAEPAA